MAENLKKMMPVLRHVGMDDSSIELLSDQVPGGKWHVRPTGDGKAFVVSCENKDAAAWCYLQPEDAMPIPVNDDFYQWVKRSGI